MIDRRALGACLLLAACMPQASAQPASKPVTLVVPYAAGGGTDTVARLISEHMARALGRSVIIENQVGGGGTIANDRVARSAPDGTTILINHVALLAAPSLFNNLRYDTQTAFEPIGISATLVTSSSPSFTGTLFIARIMSSGLRPVLPAGPSALTVSIMTP